MVEQTAQDIIRELGLQPLEPEGGHWAPAYRSQLMDANGRCACGSILYLVTPESFSHFHKLAVDEIFHFCAGDPVEQIIVAPEGIVQEVRLGADMRVKGTRPFSVVPAGCWQAARLLGGASYALLAATTVPGYTDDCVQHSTAAELAKTWPVHEAKIMRFA